MPLNSGERSMLEAKSEKYSDVIKSEHRKPKADRDQKRVEYAKKRNDVIQRWLKTK